MAHKKNKHTSVRGGSKSSLAIISTPPALSTEKGKEHIYLTGYYILTLSFLFQPTDNINAAHLFNRIRR